MCNDIYSWIFPQIVCCPRQVHTKKIYKYFCKINDKKTKERVLLSTLQIKEFLSSDKYKIPECLYPYKVSSEIQKITYLLFSPLRHTSSWSYLKLVWCLQTFNCWISSISWLMKIKAKSPYSRWQKWTGLLRYFRKTKGCGNNSVYL